MLSLILGIDGHLVINGDQLADKNDSISVIEESTVITVTINGEARSIDKEKVTDVVINGHTGADLIRVRVARPMTISGGDGTDQVISDYSPPGALLLPSGGNDTIILNQGELRIDQSQRIGRLVVNGFSRFVVPPDTGVLTVSSVTLGSPAIEGPWLDLNNNDLIVDYPPGTTSPRFFIQRYINIAREFSWYVFGITSTTAISAHNTTLGVMQSNEYFSLYGPGATFSGEPIDASAVLVRYTYYGDTDFNGVVDFDDYSRIDAGFLNERTGWLNGDFDGNDQVDLDDYVLIDGAFNTQGSSLGPALSSIGARSSKVAGRSR
ncbi:MAG: hypothetical protein H7Z14_18890 [Anaerolineae bacterium]|nr:hypothetical protein [Phycisphaerae bacterium]